MEKSLAQIAMEEFLATTYSAQDAYERVAKALEKEVLKRINKSEDEAEPVAGQELTVVQVAQWVEKHGSTAGLQWLSDSGEWRDDDGAAIIYAYVDYRVAPWKVNDHDDPATWEKGVAIFRRDEEDAPWILDVCGGYSKDLTYPYRSLSHGAYKYAKLATPEQVAAWKLINDDL